MLVRVHSECLTGDVFHSLRCDCGEQLEQALARIARRGARRPALHGAGGTRDRAAEQAQGVRAPGERPRHRRGEPRARLPGRRARVRDRLADPRRPRADDDSHPDEQPAKITGIEGFGLRSSSRCRSRSRRTPRTTATSTTKREKLGHRLHHQELSASRSRADERRLGPRGSTGPRSCGRRALPSRRPPASSRLTRAGSGRSGHARAAGDRGRPRPPTSEHAPGETRTIPAGVGVFAGARTEPGARSGSRSPVQRRDHVEAPGRRARVPRGGRVSTGARSTSCRYPAPSSCRSGDGAREDAALRVRSRARRVSSAARRRTSTSSPPRRRAACSSRGSRPAYPVSLGVLTCDTARAGGGARGRQGNKGAEAARSALEMAESSASCAADAARACGR